jgi:hypothetical protein
VNYAFAARKMIKHHIRYTTLAVAVLVFATQPVGAEVMDKEPTLTNIWLWTVVGALVALIGCSWRIWIAIISLPLALLLPGGIILDLWDSSVGKNIILEAGKGYAASVYTAALVVVCAHVVGITLRVKRKRRKTSEQPAAADRQ